MSITSSTCIGLQTPPAGGGALAIAHFGFLCGADAALAITGLIESVQLVRCAVAYPLAAHGASLSLLDAAMSAPLNDYAAAAALTDAAAAVSLDDEATSNPLVRWGTSKETDG